jgi:hypothetical protein
MDRNWFEIWMDDKESVLATMVKNMAADLNAGYNYFGVCIRRQKEEIERYKSEFDQQLMSFADMDDAKRNRWCYYDLLRRGAITR